MQREHRQALNDIFDEALADGSHDPAIAVGWAIDELRSLEAGGVQWAADYLEACMWAGLRTRIRSRARTGRAAVAGESVPTCYVTGGVMTSWMHVPVAELDSVVERLEEQAATLLSHAHIITSGQRLANQHNVDTAWLGFEAAGVSVVVAS